MRTDELLRIAEAATPGPWTAGSDSPPGLVASWVVDAGNITIADTPKHSDATFVAAFGPTVAQALVKELQAGRQASLMEHSPMYSDGPVYRACRCAVHASHRRAMLATAKALGIDDVGTET